MLFSNITLDGLQMGLCFAVLALGVYISYSILDFPDLSVDGTFPLGGVVCTVLLFRLNLPPVLPSCSPSQQAPLPGQSRDCSTLLKITPLLSAIIVMTALLSVTLALTQLLTPGGYTTTIFSYRGHGMRSLFDLGLSGMAEKGATIGILFGMVLLFKLLIDLFLEPVWGICSVPPG